jgi:hypothetical protein
MLLYQVELEEMKQRQEEAGLLSRYDGTWRAAGPELVRQKELEGAECRCACSDR